MATNLLTNPALKNAKPESKDKRLLDGGGLYLLIKANGSKWWRWDYTRPDGKRNMLSLGTYPHTSLKQARDKRNDTRKQLTEGIDPGEIRSDEKKAKQLTKLNSNRVSIEYLSSI